MKQCSPLLEACIASTLVAVGVKQAAPEAQRTRAKKQRLRRLVKKQMRSAGPIVLGLAPVPYIYGDTGRKYGYRPVPWRILSLL